MSEYCKQHPDWRSIPCPECFEILKSENEGLRKALIEIRDHAQPPFMKEEKWANYVREVADEALDSRTKEGERK